MLTSAGAGTITRSPSHGLVTGTSLGVVATTETPSSLAELDADAATVSGSPIYSNAYTQRDTLGRITQKTETIQATGTNLTYSYTNAGQLDVVSIGGTPARDYDYDANGNRTHVNGQLVGTYDAQDRLTSYSGATYTYTAAGDLETKTEAGATTTYGYDALGNLRSVVFQDGKRIEYVIDGRNRRVGKKVCAAPCTGGTAQLQQGFLYADQLRAVAELDGSNNVVSRFVYGTKANAPDYMIKSGVTYRILSDQLGSPRLIVDTATGAVAQRIDYDEWGNVTQDTSPGFQPFGFAGGIADRDTGLVRFGARDYSPEVGRWTARDPVLLAGRQTNFLQYAGADPVNAIDPTGMAPGDRYPTADDAARQAIDDVSEQSIADCIEWGGFVKKRKGGGWTYTEPVRGTTHSVEIPNRPPGGIPYHTHGCCDGADDENFSPQDKKNSDDRGVPHYLGTPTGALKRYDPDPRKEGNGPVTRLR